MIRILHIVTHMNRGGLETMLMNYYRHIDRKKIQFDFLVHREQQADYDQEILDLGGKIYRAPRLNPYSIKYHLFLKAFFEEHDFPIVHSHLNCMSGIPLSAAKKSGKSVLIAHSHSQSQEKNLKYPIKMVQKRKVPRNSDYRFACSEAAGDWLFSGEKFMIFRNAIDTDRFNFNVENAQEKKRELGIKDELVIGHVGRFNVVKNHSYIIDIFEKITEKCDARLLLIGEGNKKTEIIEKVNRLSLDKKVMFLGKREDIPELLQTMDVFLFPSLFEGLAVSLIEAQATGLPCIVSDTISEEVNVTGLIKQVSLEADIDQWVDAILLAQKNVRRSFKKELKNSGYDISEAVKKLENFYWSVLEGNALSNEEVQI